MSRDNNRKAEINILGIFKVILIIVALGGAIVLFGYYFLDWDIAGFFDGFGGGGSSGGGSASVAGGGGEEGSGLTGSIMGILIVLIIIVAAFIWWRKSRAAKKEKKGDKWIKAEGSVYDIQRKRPLPNVTVNFVPKNKKSKGKWFRTTRKATTDQDGTFSVQLKNGVKYHIEVNGISGRQWSRRWKNPKTKRFEKATRYLTPRKGFGKIDEDFLKIHVGKVPRWTTIPVQDSTVPPTPLIPTPVTTTS
ncbi:MAG: hypothetical protein QF475_00105, partial [Candidatus Undinarchaeales archaeon]|nr:hypothetical protein [Candidatus Undinarchaeales archaeon]